MTIKLFEGKRSSEMLAVQLADQKTFISSAQEMMFWFYIQAPDGSWKVADVRQLQALHNPDVTLDPKDPKKAHALTVGFELTLIREFEGKSESERLILIAG